MATGRTISASFLTDLDTKVIEFCNSISELVFNSISDKNLQKEFKKQYGKISFTRDSGLGLGGGKLQRDTISTRGRQGKSPYSNRNLRWHPLIVAEQSVNFAKPIERIEIEGENEGQILIFVVKINGKEKKYPSDKIHELPERFVALPEHWDGHIDRLKHWNDTLWTNNSCIIPAYEACEWWQAVETYSILAIGIAVELFNIDFNLIYNKIENILKQQTIDKTIQLPSDNYPNKKNEFIHCPVCKTKFTNGLSKLFNEEPENKWSPQWRRSNKIDSINNLYLIHINPLTEKSIRHNAENVRYGHKWCDITKSNKSIKQTINIFGEILKSHGENLPVLKKNDNEIVFLKYNIEKSFQTINIAIKQYFDYFSEYVKKVKGKEIYFYVKPLKEGFEFRVNPNDIEIVEKYLTEYANLVNENINDLIINFENTLLPEPIQGVSKLNLKQQLINFKHALEMATFEKKFYEKQSDDYYKIITELTELIKEKSKQPIQIFNKSLPIKELKELILNISNEFSEIAKLRTHQEERIIDYYLHLDKKINIQNKPDYQKRINQWLPDNLKLNNLSLEYLISGEFLFDALFKSNANDYSPFVLQYCRVIENELLKQFFIPFHKKIISNKTNNEIKLVYSWDFIKSNKNKDFANLFQKTKEPELMLAKMLTFLKRINDSSYTASVLFSDFKNFINEQFELNILDNVFLNKIDNIRKNYRNKAAHPDRQDIKLNLSEAQKCQTLIREILFIWIERKK